MILLCSLLVGLLFAAPSQGLSGPQVPSPQAAADGSAKQGQPDAEGVYEPGGDVLPPAVVKTSNPKFPHGVRKKAMSGDTQIGLVVDAQGVPQQVHVARSCGIASLDEEAAKAVTKYRFRPANRHGQPVPVRIIVDVNWKVF